MIIFKKKKTKNSTADTMRKPAKTSLKSHGYRRERLAESNGDLTAQCIWFIMNALPIAGSKWNDSQRTCRHRMQ